MLTWTSIMCRGRRVGDSASLFARTYFGRQSARPWCKGVVACFERNNLKPSLLSSANDMCTHWYREDCDQHWTDGARTEQRTRDFCEADIATSDRVPARSASRKHRVLKFINIVQKNHESRAEAFQLDLAALRLLARGL